MDALTSIEQFQPARMLSSGEIKNILVELTGLRGIMSLNVENDFVRIEYYQQLLSPGMLKEALARAGFPFQMQNRKQGVFRKFILQLGEENMKEFGGKPPKCCA
ncbi:MAG: hypothetical protein GXO86_06795 [Chlorobi bacterium]|nr:hypothetical protein [Chlorobiota bacterium]